MTGVEQSRGDEPAPLEVGAVIDDYRIEEVLGRGGMGLVYGVVNTVIGKRAAMKVLKRELGANRDVIERFFTEARAVNQIGHPNIVDIFGFGNTPDGQPYMVMEWLRGVTLADRLTQPIETAEICELLGAIVSALEAAHAAGIAHRDLKPENVFLASQGKTTSVKLLDFGIAKLLGGEKRLERTQTGMVMGTPAYMSPEQARGKGVDHRTDIYSLGVIAFEMFCGRSPFVADTAMDLVVAHMHQPPPVPSSVRAGIPRAVDALVLAMLEKNAAARPTLPQVAAALDEIKAGGDTLSAVPARAAAVVALPPVSATGATMLSQPPHTVPVHSPGALARRRAPWIVAAVAVIAAGGAAVVVATRDEPAPRPTAVAPPPAPPAPAPVTPAPPRPPPTAVAPTEVTLELTSTPAGARVRVEGSDEILGTTPLIRKLPRAGTVTQFVFELPGHEPQTHAITPAKDVVLAVALVPAPKRAPKPAKRRPRVDKRVERGATMEVFDE